MSWIASAARPVQKDVTGSRERQRGPRAGVAVKGAAKKKERGRNAAVAEMLNMATPGNTFAVLPGMTARYNCKV